MLSSYSLCTLIFYVFFFFNDTATTEIYTLSLHDALPICFYARFDANGHVGDPTWPRITTQESERPFAPRRDGLRSEEHTSELQSLAYLVCRLLLEKKKNKMTIQQSRVSIETRVMVRYSSR